MSDPESHKFNQDFQTWKKEQGITSDLGEILEGSHSWEQGSEIQNFEKKYPGISNEFDLLISLLPDPNNPHKSEFPFAASVVRMTENGKMEVLARSTNRVNEHNDSTQHAELAVLQDAQKQTLNKHLDGCMLLSTAQPCEMCAGAIRHTNLSTVVYAVSQKDLAGTHVQFKDKFQPHRTVPAGFDTDELLRASGVEVFTGYKRKEVLNRLKRIWGSFHGYYRDPDA